MKTLYWVIALTILGTGILTAQVRLQEDFESSDSSHFPIGWTHWNMLNVPPADTTAFWRVQDSGMVIPGIADPRRSVARSGSKAVRVSWYAGLDSNGTSYTADDWLITRRVPITVGDSLRFWATGGNGGTTGTFYPDTLEVWLGDQDSLPASQTLMLDLITWRNGTSLYGVFKKYTYSMDVAAGFDIFVSFRYHTSVVSDGFCVHMDDIQIAGPLTGVSDNPHLPSHATLFQNYPNPFNPSTTIQWYVPKSSRVTIRIFDALGQEVGTLVDAEMGQGEYRTTWDARSHATGIYFYQMQIGSDIQTRKLVLVR
jgi:hypothetical protein